MCHHNPETGETGLKPVVNTFVNEATELVHVFIDGEEIICTNEHPFYSPKKGWIEACKLRAGDILVSLNGEYIIVEQVQHEILEAPIKVYNFEVEDFHTYFVGDGDGVLVHNDCGSNGQLSKKLDYVFGKATGNKHNIDRSTGLLRSLESIGINDTPLGRSYMLNQFETIRAEVGLSQTSYSSLIYGSSGILNMETHWINGVLKTVYLYGKWGR